MPNVVVAGFPANSNVTKLVFFFKNVLKKDDIQHFWVRGMSDVRGTNLKAVTIEFTNSDEGYHACNRFDGFLYRKGELTFPLTAHVEDSMSRSPSPINYRREYSDGRYMERSERSHSRYSRRYSRERNRSRSPHYYSETSKLDMEIELLRKQRLIIEEERRLLLERKKLELVKEFGPSALREFEFSEERDRRHRGERQERPRRPPHPHPHPHPRERYSPPRPKHLPKKYNVQKELQAHLPVFFTPCKYLLKEMKELTRKYSSGNDELLLKLLRATLRKRLVILLEGKPRMANKDILVLYRQNYPISTDEQLIKKVMNDVKACELSGKPSPTPKEQSKETKTTMKENIEVSKKDDEKLIVKEECTTDAKIANENMESNEKDSESIGDIKVKEENSTDEAKEKVDSDAVSHDAADIKKESEVSPDFKGTKSEPSEKVEENTIDKNIEYALSMDASEVALALNENDTEDWGDGDDWNDPVEDSQENESSQQ